MSIDPRFTHATVRPSYPRRTRAEKAAMAVVAVLVSSTLLAAMLSLFEMRSEDTTVARAPAGAQPANGASGLHLTLLVEGRGQRPAEPKVR